MMSMPIPSPYLQAPADAPWIVGVVHVGGGTLPYPLSRRDIERDTAWALQVYDDMGLAPGGTVHLIGDGHEEPSWWPFENAAMRKRMPWIQAEASAFDAARSDMILRRFSLQAVLGLSEAVLDALEALGRDPLQFFGPLKALAATPAAADRLRALGLPVWCLIKVGPVFAFEPPQGGGARYDRSEWRIDSVDGELALTSMHARACPFARLRTGLRGQVETVDDEHRVFLDRA